MISFLYNRGKIHSRLLKKLKFVHSIKMMEEQINQTIKELFPFLMFQKQLKDTFTVSYMIALMKIFFKKYQCYFRKGFSIQHALLVMIKKNEN